MKQIEIIGNVGREPRERTTANGQKFYEFSVAVNESKDSVMWFSCCVHGEQKVLPYLEKGRCVFIRGGFTLQVYKEQPSVTINVKELQLCGPGKTEDDTVVDRKPDVY